MHTKKSGSVAMVSVIIPTLNAGNSFAKLLELLKAQTLVPHEIIIIDSCSDDATTELAEAAGAKVLSVHRAEFDHGGTRNIAAEVATGDVLLFMTQDVMPLNEHLIEEIVKPLYGNEALEDVVYSYARQIADSSSDLLEQLARANNYPTESAVKGYKDIEQLGIKTFFCSNACSAIRRDVFRKMNGFQAPVIFNEDMFMAARCILAGKKIAYCADAQVYHTHHYSIKQQFKRYFDNGVSMRCNAWILPYASATKSGSKLVKQQLAGIHAAGQWKLIPRFIGETAAKLIGYKLGMNFHRLPKFFCRRVSMHPLIWRQIERGDFDTQLTVNVAERGQSKSS